MSIRPLKHYMPRSLYGRAAMIMMLPLIGLLFLVSEVFVQRHLEEVTSKMTRTLISEIELIAGQTEHVQTRVEALEAMQPLIAPLDFKVRFVSEADIPPGDSRDWYDYSASIVIRVLRRDLPETRAVVFLPDKQFLLYLDTRLGPAEINLSRRLMTVSAPHQLIVTMVFFGFLMTVIAYVYIRNQLRPITRLARAAQAFGRGQNLPYTPRGATEVRVAGNAFLDMRARIERQIEQRTLMLSGVSHDLRTPLTRLRLGLAMMEEEEAASLLKDVDEMEQLLDAFLAFSRNAAEEGDTESVDPVALLEQIVADAKRAGIPAELVSIQGAGTVNLRPSAMRRAVENLIGNAVRYGSHAELSVALTDKSLRIRVEDDGPGIPADQHAEAIKPFSRLDPARNQNRGSGVGLGLAIVNDIARAHGGVLRFGESKKLGGLRADIVIAR